MGQRDLYEVLGVERGQSADEIKAAYRRLAREHHPDVNPGDAESEERFKEISYAKEILLDDDKRKLYDEFGIEGLGAGFDAEQSRAYRDWSKRAGRSPGADAFASNVDLDDLFGQFFGGAQHFGGRSRPPHPGIDLEADLDVDFLVAVSGGEVRLRIEGRPPLRVTVPPGAQDGSRLRLSGQGARSTPDGKAGDLYVRLRVRPHPFFEREGRDLRIDLPVTVPELILGAEVSVPTPSGPVAMKIPPGSENGRRMRLKGKGVPAAGSVTTAGDLFVRLVAVLPEQPSEELGALARKLDELYGGVDVRAHLSGGTR